MAQRTTPSLQCVDHRAHDRAAVLSDFLATVPWSPARPDTLVVCCSDGRWHQQVEEFVHKHVSERADVYAVPGGPAIFWWNSPVDENRVAERHFRFLAEHHDLRAIWLIAHEDCAFYRELHRNAAAAKLKESQIEDLERAREKIAGWFPKLDVRKIYASLNRDCVTFSTLS